MRAGSLEDEDADVRAREARAPRSRSTSPTRRSAAGIEPRLAHLLGLERARPPPTARTSSRPGGSSSSGSPSSDPVVLVFEDIQWADAGAARLHRVPARVVAQPPDLSCSRSPGRSCSSAGRLRAPAGAQLHARSTSSRSPRAAMERAARRLRARAARTSCARRSSTRRGRAALRRRDGAHAARPRACSRSEGDVYRPTGHDRDARGARDAPRADRRPAGRLDARGTALAPGRRRARQDVHQARGLAALTGLPEHELEPLLTSLVRKEVLSLQADPRSPERGQYRFLQDLVKHVAYETLSKPERKNRHLAAAAYLRGLRARGAGDRRGRRRPLPRRVPGGARRRGRGRDQGDGARDARPRGRPRRVAGGERGGRSAYFERGGRARPTTRLSRRRCTSGPGAMAWRGCSGQTRAFGALRAGARASSRRSGRRIRRRGSPPGMPRSSVRTGHLEEAIEQHGASFRGARRRTSRTKTSPPSPRSSDASSFFDGRVRGRGAADRDWRSSSLRLSALPEALSQALNTKGDVARRVGRRDRGEASSISHALGLALEQRSCTLPAPRAPTTTSPTCSSRATEYEEGVEMSSSKGSSYARRVGNRQWERSLLGEVYAAFARRASGTRCSSVAVPELLAEGIASSFAGSSRTLSARLSHAATLGRSERSTDSSSRAARESADAQEQRRLWRAKALLLLLTGGPLKRSRSPGKGSLSSRRRRAHRGDIKELFVIALEAALALDDLEQAEEVLAIVEGFRPGSSSLYLAGPGRRASAPRLAAVRSSGASDAGRAPLFREHRDAVLRSRSRSSSTASGSPGRVGPARRTARRPRRARSSSGSKATPWLARCDAAGTRSCRDASDLRIEPWNVTSPSSAAARAATRPRSAPRSSGRRRVCIEQEPELGGTCLRVGCIPTKAWVQTAFCAEGGGGDASPSSASRSAKPGSTWRRRTSGRPRSSSR